MVMIYCMSTVRAAKPQFMIPAMAGAIIGNVGMVYAPQFSSRYVCSTGDGCFFGWNVLTFVCSKSFAPVIVKKS